MEGLGHDSRYYRAIREVELTVAEDLLWDIRDLCLAATYWSSVGGLKGFDGSTRSKIAKGAPKATRKPGDQPEPKKFLNARELHKIFG